MHIAVDDSLDTPIYQQIVDHIHRNIRNGALAPGFKLPTVRELSDQSKIARGTVKHAYDTLEQLGLIQMVQGRGTFVNDLNQNQTVSKKEQAMTAIDSLLARLEELEFTAQEIRIFLDLKLREREQAYKNVRVGAIDCSPEALSVIGGQISALPHVDIYEFLLDAVVDAKQPFDPELDLLITTTSHYEQLQHLLPDGKRLLPMALSVAPHTAAELARIPKSAKTGIICASKRFADLIAGACDRYCILDAKPDIAFLGNAGLEAFIAAKNLLILPPNYLRLCSQHEQALLKAYAQTGKIIVFQYQIEKGSMMYVEEAIDRIYRTTKVN